MLVAETNAAVKRMYNSLLDNNIASDHNIDFIVSENHFTAHKNLYEAKPQLKDLLTFKKVVLCTINRAIKLVPTGLMRSRDSKDRLAWRHTLVVDESSLCTELSIFELLPYLLYFKHIVFTGDPAQRSPFCYGKYQPKSILEVLEERVRMNDKYIQHTFLNWQYRMPVDVGNMISDNFYDGKVKNARAPNEKKKLYFYDISSSVHISDNGSRVAPEEANQAVFMANAFAKRVKNFEIVILAMYADQAAFLNTICKEAKVSKNIRCHTVDSFQGGEADIIILCLSAYRKNLPNFITERKRLCVSLSRCRIRLVVIGDQTLLKDDSSWSKILKSFTVVNPKTRNRILKP